MCCGHLRHFSWTSCSSSSCISPESPRSSVSIFFSRFSSPSAMSLQHKEVIQIGKDFNFFFSPHIFHSQLPPHFTIVKYLSLKSEHHNSPGLRHLVSILYRDPSPGLRSGFSSFNFFFSGEMGCFS